jgi:hypothetical protein
MTASMPRWSEPKIADLVRVGDRDQQVGILQPGLLQHRRVRGMAGDALNIELVGDVAHEMRIEVDDGDVVALVRQVFRDVGADLAGAADHDFHEPCSIPEAQGGEAALLSPI